MVPLAQCQLTSVDILADAPPVPLHAPPLPPVDTVAAPPVE